MVRMLKVGGIVLAMGLVIASLGEASAKQPPRAIHIGPVSVQPNAKVKGITIVSSGALTAFAGVQTHGAVTCPTGKVPLGGGVAFESSALSVNVNSSYPNAANGWTADANNGTASSTLFYVFAVCAKQPAGYQVVTSLETNPAGAQTNATATCPQGAKVLGGGGYSSAMSVSVNLNTTAPASPKSWRADQNNGRSTPADITAYAICAKNVAGWKLVTGATATNPAGHDSASSAACPGTLKVLRGPSRIRTCDTRVKSPLL
jgi:hypothetical protein